MHILVPELIINEYINGNRKGEFPAVGLFVDISGFSEMTNNLVAYGQHGAEVLAIVMREVFSPLVCNVYSQGGFITNFAGDAFTALFPLEGDHQKQTKACLSAAWGIQRYMHDNLCHKTPYGDFEISAKVGIATGSACWGIVASKQNDRAAFYFRGSAVQACVDSQDLAAPGEIILDRETYDLAREYISTDQVSSHYSVLGMEDVIPGCTSIEIPTLDLEHARLFFPAELFTQTHLGEFRQVINMFINLPTVRTEDQLEILMQTIFDLQDNYGGLLNRIDFGDKGSSILLFWGAPVTFGNDIGRALNFILSLQTETSIPIKAGITYRTAHAGFIGSPLREEYTCYGPGINLAARFMTKASRGEVWVDEQIAKRVSNYFEMDFIDEISLKGFSEKQKVFVLIERKELFEHFYSGELIGRTEELNILQSFMAPIHQGGFPGIMVISGDAGIGKSRLVSEFLNHHESMKGKDILVAVCHSDQVLRRSFNPFRYWLRQYFGVSDTQVEARNKRSFNQKLDQLISRTVDHDLASELDRTRSFLGALVDLFWHDSLYEQLDPQNRYENTMIGLVSLILAESCLQPLVIHLEDIQWIDEDSKALLGLLERAITSRPEKSFPVAVLATSRARKMESIFGNDLKVEELLVRRLSESETLVIATALLDAPIDDNLAKLVVSFGEGNPFFIEQVITYLRDEGLLEKNKSGWYLKEEVEVPKPADVRALLLARLDQFPKDVKDILLQASVLGREFDLPVLAKMVGEDKLSRNFESIIESSVWAEISDDRYIFKNNLLRDTAYHTQIHAQRTALHDQALSTIEDLFQDDLRAHIFNLAHHAEHGSQRNKTCLYLKKAGEMAADSYNNLSAIDYLSRALKYLEKDDALTRIEILQHRESLFATVGDRSKQEGDLQQAQAQADELADPNLMAANACKYVSFYWLTGDYSNAIDAAKKTIRLAEESGSAKLLIRGYTGWANVARILGDFSKARELLNKARTIAQETEDKSGESSSLNLIGMLEQETGDFSQARKHLEEGFKIAQESGNLYLQAQILNNLGGSAGIEGDFSSSLAYYGQALELAQKIGVRYGEGLLRTNLGWIAGMLGDYHAARSYLEESLQIYREVGVESGTGATMDYVNLSLFSWAQTDFSAAFNYAQNALELSEKQNFRSGEAFAHTYRGHALAGLNEFNEARDAYQQALNLRKELDQNNLATEPLAGLAAAALDQNNQLEALSLISEILNLFDQGATLDGIDIPAFILFTCYRGLAAAGDPRATQILGDAYEKIQSQAEKIKDEAQRKSFLENVRWHSEIVQFFEKGVPDNT